MTERMPWRTFSSGPRPGVHAAWAKSMSFRPWMRGRGRESEEDEDKDEDEEEEEELEWVEVVEGGKEIGGVDGWGRISLDGVPSSAFRNAARSPSKTKRRLDEYILLSSFSSAAWSPSRSSRKSSITFRIVLPGASPCLMRKYSSKPSCTVSTPRARP